MSYLVIYSGLETQAEVTPGVAVYWRTGEARWVSEESLPYYLANTAVFSIAMAPSAGKPFRLQGTATSWRDMIGDLFGYRLNSVAGKANYDWDENAISFASGGNIADAGDRVQWNQEINHDHVVGDSISFYPHAHWFQSGTEKFVLTLQYRLLKNGQAKPTQWQTTTITANNGIDVYPYTSGTICQKTPTAAPITVDCSISDTLQFRMGRTDALGGTMLVYLLDLHGEVDGVGSEEIGIKA